jgi:predicted nucleotidyltransferase
VLEKITEVIDDLSRNKNVAAFYVFGSASTGNIKPLSDLDFAVLLTSTLPKKQRFDVPLSLLGDLNLALKTDEIDLILLNDVPARIAYSIIKEGRLLLCQYEKELIDFSEDTVRRYLDFKFFLDDFNDTFTEMIGYHG